MLLHRRSSALHKQFFLTVQRIRINVHRSVFFIIHTLLFIDQVLIQTYLCLFCIRCCHPVDRTFDLTSCKSASALSLRIVSTVYNCHIAILILSQSLHTLQSMPASDALHYPGTDGNIFSAAPSMKSSRSIYSSLQNGIFLLAKLWILQIVLGFQLLYFSFRIIINNQLDRIKHCHHTRASSSSDLHGYSTQALHNLQNSEPWIHHTDLRTS